MPAKIFMVRLEAAARVPQEATPVSGSHFVPFVRDGQFRFKNRKADPVNETSDAAHEKARVSGGPG